MKNIGNLILIMLLMCACSAEQKSNLANIFMNKMSFEELVDRFENEGRLAEQKPEEVIALLGDISEKKIMDIGAGTGYFTFRMADRGADIIAADVDDRFLKYITDKKIKTGTENITTRKVEYSDPLLADKEVDHAIIVNTYHHIDDRVEYFSKVAKGIKDSGSLMVVDFKKDKKSPGPPKRYRVPVAEVEDELKKAGFQTFEINTTLLENQYVVIAYKGTP